MKGIFSSSCFQVISTAEGKALAKEFGVPFFETSAKDNYNINEAYCTAASLILKQGIADDLQGVNRNSMNVEASSSSSSGNSKSKSSGGEKVVLNADNAKRERSRRSWC